LILKIAILLTLLWGNTTQHPDSVAAARYFDRFKALQYDQVDSALFFIDKAIALADIPDLKKYHAQLLLDKGRFLKNTGRFKEAEAVLQNTVNVYLELGDSLGLAETYNNLGIVYWRWLNNEKVMEYYTKSLTINRAKKNIPGQIRNYMVIGNYYAQEVPFVAGRDQKNTKFRHAIGHYNQALELLKQAPHPRNLATTLQNKGNVYADTSFSESDSSQALSNFRMSLVAFASLQDSVSIAGLEVSIGYVYEAYMDLNRALAHYQKALNLYRKLHQDAYMFEVLRNLGNVYTSKKEYALARSSYAEGMYYARRNGDVYAMSALSQNLARANAALGQYNDAYRYLDSSVVHLNKMYEENTNKFKQESEIKYETSQKESELKIKTVQRDGIMIVLIVALSLSIIIVLLSRQRQKTLGQLREKEEGLHRKHVDELLKKQEINSLVSYLNGQEEERKRVAEDLHDRLGSTLSATKLYLNSTQASQSSSFIRASELLDQAVTEVREISHNLLSGTLSRFGLLQALEELKTMVSNTNQLKMDVFTNGVTRLPTNVEIIIYRIIQELVSNILKHAHATEITVQLTRHTHELTLTVEDNGIGFDTGKKNPKSGIGLMNVESRVAALRGSFYIDSGKGNGTTITINIPVED
jgi:two-component system, NarL family, sensor kinase